MDTAARTRVFLVDDRRSPCEALNALRAASADLSFVGAARSLPDAAERLSTTRADVVLVDPHVADDPPLRALAHLRRAAPAAKLVVLADARDAATQREALLADADGVVSTSDAPGVLLKAIRTVHAGERWFDRRLLDAALRDALASVRRLDPDRARIAALTPREHEVASLVAQGLRNDEIGRQLRMSEKTVRNRVVDVCRKLGVPGRLELLVFANRHGLGRVAPDPRQR